MKKFFVYLRTRPIALTSLIILILLYFMMIFAEFFAPYSPNTSFPDKSYHPPNARFHQGKLQAQEFMVTNSVTWSYARVQNRYTPVNFFGKGEKYDLFGLIPAERHFLSVEADTYPLFLMGADSLGRCLFSRIVYGARISLTIGFAATLISLCLAILFGGLAGYYGGGLDWGIMRFAEFLMLIPGLYLILFLRSLMASNMDSGQAYMMITIILSLIGWPALARTLRGMVHSIKREEFVLNAKLEMIPSPVIIFRHIIPQIASLLIVSIALSIPGFIMTETVLSYLGLGITDPAVSWGSLIRRDISTLANLRAYPWLLSPVWFLLGVTLSFSFIGDALRDFFDPYHTRGKRKEKREKRERRKKSVNDTSPLPPHPSLLTPTSSPLPPTPSLLPPPSSPLPNQSLLAVNDLKVSFSVLRGNKQISVAAVRGFSFSLDKGECLGLVGESGSGKSVSTHAIPGLLPQNASVSGSILYEGKELLNLDIQALRKYRGKKIGMIFQEPGRSFDPLQKMEKVFYETFKNSEPKISKEETAEKAAALLEETGLGNAKERLKNFPHQFSGGQLQRIGIALALAQGCELLIADEPTTALDVTIQKQIIDLLKTLRKSRGISIIFISHNIDLVADISDRIIVMYAGLLMESAESSQITGNAKHPYTKALLASSPQFGTHYSRESLSVIPGRPGDIGNSKGCLFAPRCNAAKPECFNEVPQLKLTGNSEIRCLL